MDINDIEPLNNTNLFIPSESSFGLGALAAKIAFYNFEWRFKTLIMFNTVQVIGLHNFLKNYNSTVIVKLGRFVPKYRVPVPQFVIFGEESSEISTTIRWLVRAKYDTNAKYIIVCASHSLECDEQKIFETLRRFYVVNVILLKTSYPSKMPVALSYQIVLPEKCLNSVPYVVDLFSNCHDDKCFLDLFPERLFNFHKCRLIMSTIEQPPFMYLHNGTKEPSGTDGDIMKLAANMLNATLDLRTPTDGTDWGHYVYNNWTGSLGDIYNGLVHASACTAPLTSNKYGNFQISFTYYSMDMVWATKLPSQKPSWEKLLLPLKLQVRIALLFTFIGIILMNTLKDTKMWRKVRKVFHMGTSKYNWLFYSWVLFLGMPILKVANKRSLRILLFTWIWCCFVLRSAYQAALINSLKHPAYADEIQTFEEVLKYGLPFGGPPTLREYYYEDRRIYDNWVIVDLENVYSKLKDILEETTDFVIASNKDIIKYHIMKYNGTKQLQILPQKIVNSPTVVYLKKYSPLTSPVSFVLRVAFEAGFIERLYGRYLAHDTTLLRRYATHRLEPLSMYNFAGCFVVLILGWLLSVIYFAVEYICGHLTEE